MSLVPVCCWVLKPATENNSAVYCGAPVSYKNVRDDDGNLVRKYESLCSFHRNMDDLNKMFQNEPS